MARILDQYGRPYVIHRTRADMVRAKFDAAQSTDENTRHWSYTDSLAADASASYSVRKTLRERGLRQPGKEETGGLGTLARSNNHEHDNHCARAGGRVRA